MRLTPVIDSRIAIARSCREKQHLWSRAVSTSRNRWQIEPGQKRRKHARTVAVSCDRSQEGAHGKEGVEHAARPPSRGAGEQDRTEQYTGATVPARPDLQHISLMELAGLEPATSWVR